MHNYIIIVFPIQFKLFESQYCAIQSLNSRLLIQYLQTLAFEKNAYCVKVLMSFKSMCLLNMNQT